MSGGLVMIIVLMLLIAATNLVPIMQEQRQAYAALPGMAIRLGTPERIVAPETQHEYNLYAQCPGGYTVLSGGWNVLTDQGFTGLVFKGSYPSGDKWYVNVINQGVPFKAPPTVQAVALCGLTSTYGAALTRAPATHSIVAPGALVSFQSRCNSNEVVVGGGWRVTSPNYDSVGWYIRGSHGHGSTGSNLWDVDAYNKNAHTSIVAYPVAQCISNQYLSYTRADYNLAIKAVPPKTFWSLSGPYGMCYSSEGVIGGGWETFPAYEGEPYYGLTILQTYPILGEPGGYPYPEWHVFVYNEYSKTSILGENVALCAALH
jgi:hypothetical protein